MKVKILQAMNEKRLEEDVNEFIQNSQIKSKSSSRNVGELASLFP